MLQWLNTWPFLLQHVLCSVKSPEGPSMLYLYLKCLSYMESVLTGCSILVNSQRALFSLSAAPISSFWGVGVFLNPENLAVFHLAKAHEVVFLVPEVCFFFFFFWEALSVCPVPKTVLGAEWINIESISIYWMNECLGLPFSLRIVKRLLLSRI